MSAQAYPLTWPDTLPRTERKVDSRFKTALSAALKNVRGSLNLFAQDSGRKVESLVISSNVTLGNERPQDPGVAVWFVWDGMQVCIAVDRYPKAEDNLQAIHHIIEARRTEMRHGGLHIVRATFRGFTALPAPRGKRSWREVFGYHGAQMPSKNDINTAWRELSKKAHPDGGGSDAQMAELNEARASAFKEIGG